MATSNRPETILEAIQRGETPTRADCEVIVDALEADDPGFFTTYPTDYGDPPTREEKLEAVRDCLKVYANRN